MLRFIKKIFNRKAPDSAAPSSIQDFIAELGLETENPELFDRALTHGSFVKRQVESNERLEFVGDAVLGAIIADILYAYFPGKNEGKLTSRKISL